MEASFALFLLGWFLFSVPHSASLAVSEARTVLGCVLLWSWCFTSDLPCRVTYGRTLESSTFQFSTPDFVYMFIFGMGCMLVSRLCATYAHLLYNHGQQTAYASAINAINEV